jgi:hypothetical protein
MRKLLHILLLIVSFGNVSDFFSQVNFTGDTPLFTVDLTGNPGGTWVSPAVGWDGTYNGELCQVGTYVWKIVTKD